MKKNFFRAPLNADVSHNYSRFHKHLRVLLEERRA